MRLVPALVLCLAACAPGAGDDPSLLPVEAAGPGSIVLEMDYLVRGERVNIDIFGLVPNRPAVILYTSAGPQTPGFCPPPAQPTCTDLAGTPGVVGTPTANANGEIHISAVVPPALPFPQVTFQVVQTNPFNSSNTVTLQNLTSTGDQDGDGLTNGEEVGTYDTNPFEADSDGGGVDDGDEVANGTDPNDPNDDLLTPGIDALAPGDLVITEFLANPNGIDADKEWVEIYNASGFDVDLAGLEVRTGASAILGSYVLAAGDVVVVGQSNNPAVNGGAPVDIAVGASMTLPNGAGTLRVVANSLVLDAVDYDAATWPVTTSASTELGDQWTDADNAEKAYWCVGTGPFGTNGDWGTPGAANGDCAVTVSWTSFFNPVILSECTGCHTGGGNQGNRNFDTYAEAFQASDDVPSMQLITPFDPDNSYILRKLAGTQAAVGGSGNRMPVGGPFFDAATLDTLRDWVLLGAPQFDSP